MQAPDEGVPGSPRLRKDAAPPSQDMHSACSGRRSDRSHRLPDQRAYQVMIELIGATTTRTGLTVHADADTGSYPRGININDAHLAAIAPQLKLDKFHGEWNYTFKPAAP